MAKVLTTETNPGVAQWTDAGTITETQFIKGTVQVVITTPNNRLSDDPVHNILAGNPGGTSLTAPADGTYILTLQTVTIVTVVA